MTKKILKCLRIGMLSQSFFLWLILPISVAQADMLISSGFETDVIRSSGKSNHDFIKMRFPSGKPVDVHIQYQGGDATGRYARITEDPSEKGNQVLHFWLNKAQIKGEYARWGKKGRIQMNLNGINLTEAYQRVRVFLHKDISLYSLYPDEYSWFGINELRIGGKKGRPFRISLSIGKKQGVGMPLVLFATGSVKDKGIWVPVWVRTNKNFSIPFGEWMNMEVGYKQGDNKSGRYYVGIKTKLDSKVIPIIDVHNWTYDPKSKYPEPLAKWNPLKIYTSEAIINHIRNSGGIAQVYWDNMEIFDKWPQSN